MIAWDSIGREGGTATRLNTSRWANVDAMLCDVAPCFEKLEYCDEFYVFDSGLTDVGVQAVCNHLPPCNNQAVSFQSDGHITDNAIATLVARYPRLTSLGLYDTNISDQGIAYLQKLPELKYLKIEGKSKITPEGRRQVVALPALIDVVIPINWIDDPYIEDIFNEGDLGFGLSDADDDTEDGFEQPIGGGSLR